VTIRFYFLPVRAADRAVDDASCRHDGLGMLTSYGGFAIAFLPSGFPGLAQLGAYSVSGLMLPRRSLGRAAALLPGNFRWRDLAPAGERLANRLRAMNEYPRVRPWTMGPLPRTRIDQLLFLARHSLWNREFSRVGPSCAELRLDARLRSDLGAPDSLDLVVVQGASLDSALGRRTGPAAGARAADC